MRVYFAEFSAKSTLIYEAGAIRRARGGGLTADVHISRRGASAPECGRRERRRRREGNTGEGRVAEGGFIIGVHHGMPSVIHIAGAPGAVFAPTTWK